MQLYEIIIPVTDNAGNRWPKAFTDSWEDCLLTLFGGFTRVDVQGAWIGEGGKRFDDRSYAYRVASDQDDVGLQLVTSASRRFTDQEAFCVAVIGEAWIRECEQYLEAPIGTVRRPNGDIVAID